MSDVAAPVVPDDTQSRPAPSQPSNVTSRRPVYVPPPPPELRHRDVEAQRSIDVWTLLVAVRIVNALTLATFFQPDEFYQALEPAWRLAFGPDSGAWITWEWTHQLRSSLYPWFFAGLYTSIDRLCAVAFIPPTLRTQLLHLLPKGVQAGIAGLMDYFTWRVTERLFGLDSHQAAAAMYLMMFNPWQWFVSTRTLSNGAEATLTAMALFFWPWEWLKTPRGHAARKEDSSKLKYCIVLAAVACSLRPTNVIIWVVLALFTLPFADQNEFLQLLRDASVFGSATLGAAQYADYLYYGKWTYPTVNFLEFNLTKDLAVFYGQNRFDYYFTEALPILLTMSLPFAVVGIVQPFLSQPESQPVSKKASAEVSKDATGVQKAKYPASALQALVFAALAVPIAFSFISHKEVRFIYPILPILTVLSAYPVASFFAPFPSASTRLKKAILLITVTINVAIAVYVGFFHNRGVMEVMGYLRSEYEAHNPDMILAQIPVTDVANLVPFTVGFLMPCHSTAWRSRLVYPGIDAWALTCEPPIDVPLTERAGYVDEADAFYAEPRAWIKANMHELDTPVSEGRSPAASERKEWPQYLVFFEQLEPVMKETLRGTLYHECWRTWNSHWHDDWRRRGDVVVYCVDLGRKVDLSAHNSDFRNDRWTPYDLFQT